MWIKSQVVSSQNSEAKGKAIPAVVSEEIEQKNRYGKYTLMEFEIVTNQDHTSEKNPRLLQKKNTKNGTKKALECEELKP